MPFPSVKVYSAYFARSVLFSNAAVTPIQVGANLATDKLAILGDDSGDNISKRNPSYCEMTAVYWAWKNDRKSDYVGLFHYRRYLDFRPEQERVVDHYGLVRAPHLGEVFSDRFGLDQKTMVSVLKDLDGVIPEAFDVRSLGPATVREHYATAPHHHADHLELAARVIDELSPSYSPFFEQTLDGYRLYPANMFVFKRALFEAYCEWIFPILKRLDAEIDTSGFSAAESRAVGYLAERLTTAFIIAQTAINPNLKLKELKRVQVESTTLYPAAPPLPKSKLPLVTVVASCDSAYVAHLSALISSILDNAATGNFVEFIILDGGLSSGQRRLLDRMIHSHVNCSLSFLDMSKAFLFVPVHSYFARPTFYRLALPDILTNRDRVIFLDTDMVVTTDLSELMSLNLGNALIAAAPDLVMRSFVRMKVRSIASTGSQPAAEYLAGNLGLKNTDDYFQGGTLVMDLQGMRKLNLADRMVDDLACNTYWFLDQDVLNKHLVGRVKFLENRWNTIWFDDHHRSYLTPQESAAYATSMDSPAVVHFAGMGKPWETGANPLSHWYWQWLRQTPWYETVLFSALDNRASGRPIELSAGPGEALTVTSDAAEASIPRRIAGAVWRKLPSKTKSQIWPFASWLAERIR